MSKHKITIHRDGEEIAQINAEQLTIFEQAGIKIDEFNKPSHNGCIRGFIIFSEGDYYSFTTDSENYKGNNIHDDIASVMRKYNVDIDL